MNIMGINIGAPNTVGQMVNVAELYGLSAGSVIDLMAQYMQVLTGTSAATTTVKPHATAYVVLYLWSY